MMRTMMAEENVDGALLRRGILLLVAAVVVASMIAATASPAFAVRHRDDNGLNFLCTNGSSGEVILVNGGDRNTLEDQGFTCEKVGKRRI